MRTALVLSAALLSGCIASQAAKPDLIRATSLDMCVRPALEAHIRRKLSEFHGANPAPGFTLAAGIPMLGGAPVAVAVGESDTQTHRPMRPDDRMLVGSVGKTFYAAAALALARDGLLDLDVPIERYLPDKRLPNANRVTPRMLLSHRSGYPPYDATFMQALIDQPLRVRDFADWMGPIVRSKSFGRPGYDYAYSDINFVLLAQVISTAAGKPAEEFIRQRFLDPIGLHDTYAADAPRLPGLVTGYEGQGGLFGSDAVVSNGELRYNPQFESGGGGFVSTSANLVRWMDALSGGHALPALGWRTMTTPASVAGPHKLYGLGIHIDRTPAGTTFGHGGYIPGYLSWVRAYPQSGLVLAMQANASDESRIPGDGYALLDALAAELSARCLMPGWNEIRDAREAIQDQADRSVNAVMRKDVDAFLDGLPADFSIGEDEGTRTTLAEQRANLVRQWSIIDRTWVYTSYIERLELTADGAEVWTSQLWERDMRGRDGKSTFRVVTTNPHRESWSWDPVKGWQLRTVQELGGQTLVDGVKY